MFLCKLVARNMHCNIIHIKGLVLMHKHIFNLLSPNIRCCGTHMFVYIVTMVLFKYFGIQSWYFNVFALFCVLTWLFMLEGLFNSIQAPIKIKLYIQDSSFVSFYKSFEILSLLIFSIVMLESPTIVFVFVTSIFIC